MRTERRRGRNLVIIMSDEHNHNWSGCYGHELVKTPNLDSLAARGTRFSSAYCNSPICVPSRAAFATGRYVHQTGHWDNAFPYAGEPDSWHHAVRDAGLACVSIGKLHFRGGDDNGFTEELLPLHVVDGVGDVKGAIRNPLPAKKGCDALARDAGRNISDYARYDFAIRDRAVAWLQEYGNNSSDSPSDTPFVLFVSLVMPHFPLQAPAEYFDMYDELSLEQMMASLNAPHCSHPVVQSLKKYMNYDDFFDDNSRANALKAYLGMVSAVDAIVGDIVSAIELAGLTSDTCVAYTSDHGENLGNRGLWGKSVMYDDASAIPLILAGPGIPSDHVCSTPVSLIDMYPTVMDVAQIETTADRPGSSLIDIATSPPDNSRAVFSEYHAAGSSTGMFMLRRGAFKLVAYPGFDPQLFDLNTDPDELHDLSGSPDHSDTLAAMQLALASICDIDKVNEQVFAQQADLVERHGGRDAVLTGLDIPHTPAPV